MSAFRVDDGLVWYVISDGLNQHRQLRSTLGEPLASVEIFGEPKMLQHSSVNTVAFSSLVNKISILAVFILLTSNNRAAIRPRLSLCP